MLRFFLDRDGVHCKKSLWVCTFRDRTMVTGEEDRLSLAGWPNEDCKLPLLVAIGLQVLEDVYEKIDKELMEFVEDVLLNR
jgi:hypothetical protein